MEEPWLKMPSFQVCVCVCAVFSVYSIATPLGHFHIVAILNNAALNISKQISLQYTEFISFGYILKSGIVGSHGSSFFKIFWGGSIVFSIGSAPITWAYYQNIIFNDYNSNDLPVLNQ